MPLVNMTMVWASETMTRMEMFNRMSLKFSRVRKLGLRRLIPAIRMRMNRLEAHLAEAGKHDQHVRTWSSLSLYGHVFELVRWIGWRPG
jgi:hypothetical protein